MSTFRLGIAGGCLNTGFGLIPLSSVYHRILARRTLEQSGVRLRVHLGNLENPDPSRHLQEVDRLLEAHPLDGLIYQVRPEFLWGLNTLVWKHREHSGLASLRSNSYREGPTGWTVGDSLARPVGKLRGLNWGLARLAGISPRARKCLRDSLAAVREHCRVRGVPLALIGPLSGPWFLGTFQDAMLRQLDDLLSEWHLPCLDTREVDWRRHPECWFDDGQHLNATGHARIAELAGSLIAPWLGKQFVEGGPFQASV